MDSSEEDWNIAGGSSSADVPQPSSDELAPGRDESTENTVEAHAPSAAIHAVEQLIEKVFEQRFRGLEVPMPNQQTIINHFVKKGLGSRTSTGGPTIEQQHTTAGPSVEQSRGNLGNFSLSSRGIRLDDDGTLSAECRGIQGYYNTSRINLTWLLRNDNGNFRWSKSAMPNDDFKQSVRDLRLSSNGETLTAELLDDQGQWSLSTIGLDERIENRNGTLNYITTLLEFQFQLVIPVHPNAFKEWDPHSQSIATTIAINCRTQNRQASEEEIESAVVSNFERKFPGYSSEILLGSCELKELFTLVWVLFSRYCRTHLRQHLEQYLDTCAAIERKFKGIPELSTLSRFLTTAREIPDFLRRLAKNICDEAERTHGNALADEAIRIVQDAQDLTPDAHPDSPQLKLRLCRTYFLRYQITSSEDDLKIASAVATTFLADYHQRDELRGQFLNIMAACQADMDKASGIFGQRQEVVNLFEESMSCMGPPQDIQPLMNLLKYAAQDETKVDVLDISELEQKIKIQKKVLDQITTERWALNPCVIIQIIVRYSSTLCAAFTQNGDFALINESLYYSRLALDVCAEHRQKFRLSTEWASLGLETTAYALTLKFDRTGATDDLDLIIECLRTAVACAAERGSSQPSLLNQLAGSLGSRYERNTSGLQYGSDEQNKADLEEAIAAAELAIKLSHPNSTDQETASATLSKIHAANWATTQEPERIDDLVRVHKEFLDRLPTGHSRRGYHEAVLAGLMLGKFQMSGSVNDYEKAMSYARDVYRLTPANHPDRPLRLSQLAKAIFTAFTTQCVDHVTTPADEDVQMLIDGCHEVMHMPQAQIYCRVEAGLVQAKAHISCDQWPESVRCFEEVIDLLKDLVPLALTRRDQEWYLSRIPGLPSMAASTFLMVGDMDARPEEQAKGALRALESSRGILAGMSVMLKKDISDLEAQNPQLAARYNLLRQKLATGYVNANDFLTRRSPQLVTTHATPVGFLERLKATEEIRELEKEIRTVPGFNRFQLRAPIEELPKLRSKLTIVQFVVSTFRADAILITNSSVRPMALPMLYAKEISRNVNKLYGPNRLSKGTGRKLSKNNKELAEILSWLWETAVKPVLAELGLLVKDNRRLLPRIWWSATGVASQLPFHAAGEGMETRNNTFDYVVSSYTPSLAALISACKSEPPPKLVNDLSMLLITMPTTPSLKANWSPLNSEDEGKEIRQRVGGLPVKELRNPTRSEVLESFSEATIAHFICHGHSTPDNPSNSSLILGRKDAPQADRLTVRDLVATAHKNAKIAYLSACSTAENSSYELSDEFINMASSFQLAGFPHVIATMWEAKDRAAVPLAGFFYEELMRYMVDSTTYRSGHDVVAYALHDALHKLRTQKFKGPLFWATFVHLGA